MKKRSELFFSLLLVPIDYLMMVSGFVIAYIIRVKLELKPTIYQIPATEYLQIILYILPIWILIFALNGLYNLSSNRSRLNEFIRLAVSTISGVMILIFIDFFTVTPLFPSKSVPVYGLVFAFMLIYSARLVLRFIQTYLWRFGIGVHNVIILGQGSQAKQLNAQFRDKKSGYNVVYFSTYKIKETALNKIKEIHSQYSVDEVINADFNINESDLLEIIRYCAHKHIAYKYLPSLTDVYQAKVISSTISGVPVLELAHTPLEGWGRIVKRLFDTLTSALALIVLSPIFLVIALLIKLSDKGRIFYSHQRLGRSGQIIRIYKFRTMKEAYSTGEGYNYKDPIDALKSFGDPKLVEEFKKYQKLKNDPRISRIGKFLRRSSLDELPQLYNVLRGDLSMVGPRPVVAEELARFGDNGSHLLMIRPGLTGLWQVSGRNDISYDERAKLELYYVENWSLQLDISILLKTIWLLTKGANGY